MTQLYTIKVTFYIIKKCNASLHKVIFHNKKFKEELNKTKIIKQRLVIEGIKGIS